MIKSLYIKNFILINELLIDFERGINVFTGETGAGKTIILRAIDIVFGAKVNKDVIKNPNQTALIELVFDDNGKEIIISREISMTGTKPRINGAFVNLDEIKTLRENLIDIHSQHQTYTYLSPKFHIELLDDFIAKENADYPIKLQNYKEKFLEYKEISEKIEKLKANNEQNQRQIDFLKFQIKEIEEAEILDNEEEDLRQELEILANIQNLKEASYGAYWALQGEDYNIVEALSKINSNLNRGADLDKNLETIKGNLMDSLENLRECANDLRNYSENLNDDPKRLDEINERLSLIEKLKRKYAQNGENLALVLENFIRELETLENCENNLDFMENKLSDIKNELTEKAQEISVLRHKSGEILSNLIENELKKLELEKSKFEIKIDETDFNLKGTNAVEFLITTNVSQPLMPLMRVASGGEISRVMLAIKIIFANTDKIKAIIFDEIDTGISGKTSQSVANTLNLLSESCQIIIITHQAIIAAAANAHFYVSKTQEEETKVKVEKLNTENRVRALAQMASGEISESSISFAKELLASKI